MYLLSRSIPDHTPCLQNRVRAAVAHAAISERLDVAAALVPHKLELCRAAQLLQPGHDYPNRMPPADRVARLLERIQPDRMLACLARLHALEINVRNALPDARPRRAHVPRQLLALRRAIRTVVSIAEARAPVRKVGTDNEDVRRVREIRRKQLAEALLSRGRRVSHKDRDDGNGGALWVGAREAVAQVGQVHFNAVLGFVDRVRHLLKGAGGLQCFDCCLVEAKGA